MKKSRFAPRSTRIVLLGYAVCGVFSAFGQVQNYYYASNVTGQLVLAGTVNLASIQSAQGSASHFQTESGTETARLANRLSHGLGSELPRLPGRARFPRRFDSPERVDVARPMAQSLVVNGTVSVPGFNAISHYDQRNANSGNQFSIEPPSPSLAVANGFVLEGVNNAIRILPRRVPPW